MIHKIMLIIPPNTIPKDNIKRIGEPLGVLSIATYLRLKGYIPYVYDMTLEGYDNHTEVGEDIVYGSSDKSLKEKIHEFLPDLIGISCMFTSKEALTLHIAKIIKEENRDIPIIAGGIAPTVFPEQFLKTGDIDFVVMNDGEVRIEKLITNLKNNISPETDLDGIAFYRGDTFVHKPPSSLNTFFANMPIPDRHLIPMEKYLQIGKPYSPFTNGRRTAHIVASKGCPFDCIFCTAVNFVGRKVHQRSVESIITEIKGLIQDFGIQEVQFMDDNLTINKSFAIKLFTEIKKLNIHWCTPNGLFFNSLDEELLTIMSASGCYQITLAIESGSQRVLKEIIKKSVNIDNVKNITDKAHSLGLAVHGLFVVGFPGESLEELHTTLDFPFKNNFDSVSFSIANAFKGSRLYTLCKEKKYKVLDHTKVNYRRSNFIIPQESPDYTISRKELEKLVDETTQKFFEWSKNMFPEIYQRKYGIFASHKHQDKEKIRHRI